MSDDLLKNIEQFARWHHLNEKLVEAGETPSDSEIDFEATAWNGIKHAISTMDAEVKELRAKLFPYADATEISGISWDGKYLIGDKESIRFFHEMKNRGEQIDVYRRSYDERLAAKDAEIERLRNIITSYPARSGEPLEQFEQSAYEWWSKHIHPMTQGGEA